jgi:MFS family permease
VTEWRERNFIANVLDGAFFSLAMSLVSIQTVLPVFVKNIGGGNIAIGLIPVVWIFGFSFPQVFIASYTQRQSRKKALLLKTAIGQRIPWLLLAILSFFVLGHVSTGVALLLFFILYALAAVGGSLNLPVWFDLIAKLTPVKARGRLFAARAVTGSVLGILGGAVAAWVLGAMHYPESFTLLLFLSFLTMIVSYLFLTRLREESDSVAGTGRPDWTYILSLPRILRTERNFRNFLIGDAMLTSSTMANGFFAVHALQKFSLADAAAGTFTIAIMASMIGGSLFFGPLADRFGHRLNLQVSSLATLAACLVALLAPSAEVYVAVFIFSAANVASAGISRLPLIAELCPESQRATSVALANMVTSPFVLFGIVAGWIANVLGYNAVFLMAGLCAIAAFVWIGTMVAEPRHRAVPSFITEGNRHEA